MDTPVCLSHDSLLSVQLQEEDTEAPSPAGTKFNIPKTLRYPLTHTHTRACLSLGRCSREVLSLFGSGGTQTAAAASSFSSTSSWRSSSPRGKQLAANKLSLPSSLQPGWVVGWVRPLRLTAVSPLQLRGASRQHANRAAADSEEAV